jgi:histidine triad (HIT) family protein
MEDDLYLGLMQFSKYVALRKQFRAKELMVVVGLEVPHAHVHLIPLNEMDENAFSK